VEVVVTKIGTYAYITNASIDPLGCEDSGVTTVLCPAQIQLPFFGLHSLIVIKNQ